MGQKRFATFAVILVGWATIAACADPPERTSVRVSTPSPMSTPEATAAPETATPVERPVAAARPRRELPGEPLDAPVVRRPAAPAPAAQGPPGIQRLGTIEIPKIRLNTAFYEGTAMRVLEHGPGHWHGKPLPGQQGNVAISGHRTTYTHPFRHIDQLRNGDTIVYRTADGVFTYSVFDYRVITPDEWWVVEDTDDWITVLMACHPPGSAKYRYVVRARLTAIPTPTPTPQPDPTPKPKGLIPFG